MASADMVFRVDLFSDLLSQLSDEGLSNLRGAIAAEDGRRISMKNNPDLIVTFRDWNPVETYYWIPTSIEFTHKQDLKISIHYSQFQIELRKLT